MYRIGQEEIDAVARVINSKELFKINGGPNQEVMNFEREWREKFGVEYSIAMTSGCAALTSALIAMGVGPGDEVIVPAYTYIATALAVTSVGAIPVIAECDETMTLDAADTEKKLSKHTKAIIPVHIQGFPSDMDSILALASKHGIKVLEDACQSDGGSYRGRRLGTLGDAGAYSFNYFKIITAGEGGMLVTGSHDIFEKSLIYHDSAAVAFFGNQLEGVDTRLFGGTEYRISEITGAIMREQLKKLDGLLSDLRSRKKLLSEQISGIYALAPSHDPEGDCGTTLSLRFETSAEARSFAKKCADKGVGVTIPIDTGKHVYTNWTQIMERRGALNPAMDPYLMPQNASLNYNYTPDMCPKSLDYLARTAYIMINPDWTDADIEAVAGKIK